MLFYSHFMIDRIQNKIELPSVSCLLPLFALMLDLKRKL